jgi:uncharacterized protein (TIGR02466 family)
MFNKETLFATPIWQFNLKQNINDKLLEESEMYISGNYFDMNLKFTKELKNTIQDVYIKINYEYGLEERNINGRLNIINYGENDTPHSHIGKSLLVGIYYLDVHENTGDLLLHDPRGGIVWENLNFTPNDPIKQKKSRTYHRIKPNNGLLILFPSYLIHSVETNLNIKPRKSIVINI